MPDLDRRPAYRLTQAQAADLLGVSTARVAELVGQGRLTPVAKWVKAGLLRADVERLLERWKPGDPTWLTTGEVAAVLGVTQPRVSISSGTKASMPRPDREGPMTATMTAPADRGSCDRRLCTHGSAGHHPIPRSSTQPEGTWQPARRSPPARVARFRDRFGPAGQLLVAEIGDHQCVRDETGT